MKVPEYCGECHSTQDFIIIDDTEIPMDRENSIVEARCIYCKKKRRIWLNKYFFKKYHEYLKKEGEKCEIP